jgi:hypothetical protein
VRSGLTPALAVVIRTSLSYPNTERRLLLGDLVLNFLLLPHLVCKRVLRLRNAPVLRLWDAPILCRLFASYLLLSLVPA